MATSALVPEVAHQLGLIPLAWLTALRAGGERRSRLWWLVALGFGASWIADWLAHVMNGFTPGPAYLVAQAGLITWAIAPHHAGRFLVLLIGTSLFVFLQLDMRQPDILMHVVAWGGLLLLCWPEPLPPLLRLTLLIAFGIGGIAWLIYVISPGWCTWLAYQTVRAFSLVAFCGAAWSKTP